MLKQLIKEPLLIFLLLSAGLFLVFRVTGGTEAESEKEEIFISNAQVEVLLSGFEKVWQRLPSQQELNGLVQEYIREEILYREALKMGLDNDDAIIRRRLRQKMEFISEDIANLRQASEEDLQAYLDNNPGQFRTADRYTFSQVYLNSSQRGAAAAEDAAFILQELRRGAGFDNVNSLGDSLMMIDSHYANVEDREIARLLGSSFLENIRDLPVGSWQGPVESGFGLHLVRMEEHIPGQVPPLGSIRRQVESEWMSQQRENSNEAFYAALRESYEVVLEEFPEPEQVPAGEVN